MWLAGVGVALVVQQTAVEQAVLVGQVVVPQLIVAYIVFVELIVEPVVALAALAESVVEQRVLLAVVMDSSQASHCSSVRACSRLASRANTFLTRQFPNAGACCWRCGN